MRLIGKKTKSHLHLEPPHDLWLIRADWILWEPALWWRPVMFCAILFAPFKFLLTGRFTFGRVPTWAMRYTKRRRNAMTALEGYFDTTKE